MPEKKDLTYYEMTKEKYKSLGITLPWDMYKYLKREQERQGWSRLGPYIRHLIEVGVKATATKK